MGSTRRRWGAALTAALAAITMTLAGASIAAADPASLERLAGNDRYGTAQRITGAYHSPGVDNVYIALGTNYPDALAGAPAAVLNGSPVLLVRNSNQLPAPTHQALQRLQPGHITILGGPSVIPAAIATALEGYTSGSVERIQGPNRYATSVAVSAATFDPGVDRVYIASGVEYADALTATPQAGADQAPILLTQPNNIPQVVRAELERLQPREIVVLGGRQAITSTVLTNLRTYTSGSVERLAGNDRYATSVAISKDAYPGGTDTVVLATGQGFADALAGGPAAAIEDAPILLVQATNLPNSVRAELVRLDPDEVIVLGGTTVISNAVAQFAADPDRPSTSREAAAALAALDGIRVTTTEAPGYDRSEFGSGWWQRDGCNTRHTILQRDFVQFTINDNCVVQTGTLDDPYTGQRLTYSSSNPNAIQIDHVVPVSAAWKMGANTWTYQERRTFYNDHDNLLAVHGPTNASKGDKTLGEWQPPNRSFHCDYAITYIEVTDDWDLALKPIDVDYAEELLPAC